MSADDTAALPGKACDSVKADSNAGVFTVAAFFNGTLSSSSGSFAVLFLPSSIGMQSSVEIAKRSAHSLAVSVDFQSPA